MGKGKSKKRKRSTSSEDSSSSSSTDCSREKKQLRKLKKKLRKEQKKTEKALHKKLKKEKKKLKEKRRSKSSSCSRDDAFKKEDEAAADIPLGLLFKHFLPQYTLKLNCLWLYLSQRMVFTVHYFMSQGEGALIVSVTSLRFKVATIINRRVAYD